MDIRAARAPRAGAAATALYGLSPQGPDALLTAVCRSEDIAFDEARELARTAAQCAADGLRAEWSLVEAVTRALLERGAVTADDLTGLYADTHDGQIPPAQQYAPRLTALARAGFRRSDSTWRYLDGVSGPQLSLTSTGDIIGELVTTELDARGLQLCRLVSVGGDASTDPQFGSVTMIGAVLPSTALPPTDGPPVGGLFADWNPTEGSGQVVTAKNLAAGVRDLVLGDTTGNSTRDPISWSTSPPKLRTQGFLTVDHHYLHHDSIPSLASGCSIFFYGSILAATSFLNRALCGVDTGVEDHRIVITSGGNIAAVVREAPGSTAPPWERPSSAPARRIRTA